MAKIYECFDTGTNRLGCLTKLKQSVTVEDFIASFERLAFRTEGMSDDFFQEFFINGLKDEIRAHVLIAQPHVRKTGPQSNKIKQMQKQNTEDTQYKRDKNLRGSPSVGYVHQRNCRSFLYYYTTNEGIQPTSKPSVTSSSFSHSLLSQNTIFTINHSRDTFPS